MAPDVVGKQLEALKEMVLRNPDNPASGRQSREAEAAAQTLGIRLQILEARGPEEIELLPRADHVIR